MNNRAKSSILALLATITGYLVATGALSHSTAQRNATLSGSNAVGGTTYNGGAVKFDSTSPATADAAQGTILATVTMNATAFAAPSAGSITANSMATATIAATGTAATARIVAVSDTGAAVTTTQPRVQGTVGTSGADFIVSSTSFVSGGQISITSLVYNHPV
jgi:hypothetical protein